MQFLAFFSFSVTKQGRIQDFFRRGCTRLLLYFNTNKPHICFFLQNTSCIRKPQVILGGGGAHPLHPPPRSAPAKYEEKCSKVSCLFYQSLLSAIGKPVFAAKKGLNSRWVKPWRKLPEAKGETSTLKTGKFCYNATNINVFVLVHLQNCKSCKRAPSARRLSPQGGE